MTRFESLHLIAAANIPCHQLQTLQSEWCNFEIEHARSKGIPLICVIDADRQLPRQVIDGYMTSNHGYLFDNQVITYTTQAR